jgi:hypothetical protein
MKRYIHGCEGTRAREDASDERVEAPRRCRLHRKLLQPDVTQAPD